MVGGAGQFLPIGRRSEPVSFVDHVAERPPGQEAPAVVEQDLEPALVEIWPIAGGVRGEEDARHRPQRVIGRQRLLLEHVEAGPGDFPRPQGPGEIVEPRRHAASDVDEERAALHPLKARPMHESSVAGVCGTVRTTKSARGRSASRASGPWSSATPGGWSRRRASTPMTRRPKAAASRAASAPMPPTPTMSTVASGRWMTPVSRGAGRHSRRNCRGKYWCSPRAKARMKAMMCAPMWSL